MTITMNLLIHNGNSKQKYCKLNLNVEINLKMICFSSKGREKKEASIDKAMYAFKLFNRVN